MTNLNSQDIEILIDALDAWIDKDAFENAITELIEGMTQNRMDAATRAAFEKKRKERLLEATVARETRKRFATLLKARLYSIKEARWMEPEK